MSCQLLVHQPSSPFEQFFSLGWSFMLLFFGEFEPPPPLSKQIDNNPPSEISVSCYPYQLQNWEAKVPKNLVYYLNFSLLYPNHRHHRPLWPRCFLRYQTLPGQTSGIALTGLRCFLRTSIYVVAVSGACWSLLFLLFVDRHSALPFPLLYYKLLLVLIKGDPLPTMDFLLRRYNYGSYLFLLIC